MTPDQKFPLGRIVATPAALERLAANGSDPAALLIRHATGDWGDVSADDAAANDQDVVQGERLLSAYTLPDGGKVWVITERDRSVTTVLLPSDY